MSHNTLSDAFDANSHLVHTSGCHCSQCQQEAAALSMDERARHRHYEQLADTAPRPGSHQRQPVRQCGRHARPRHRKCHRAGRVQPS